MISIVRDRIRHHHHHQCEAEDGRKEEISRVKEAVQKIEAVKEEEKLTSRRKEKERSRKNQIHQVSQKSVCKRKYQEVSSGDDYLLGLWPEAERKPASTAHSRSLDFVGNRVKTSTSSAGSLGGGNLGKRKTE